MIKYIIKDLLSKPLYLLALLALSIFIILYYQIPEIKYRDRARYKIMQYDNEILIERFSKHDGGLDFYTIERKQGHVRGSYMLIKIK